MSSLENHHHMPQNKYVEYRKWIAFWGLLLDSQKEIQKMIDDYNSKGWKVVQFQYTRPNFSIGKLLLILLITAITFGFISYWIGVSIIFEREDEMTLGNSKPKKSASKPPINSEQRIQEHKDTKALPNDSDTEKIKELNSIIEQSKGGLFNKYNPEVVDFIKQNYSDSQKALGLIKNFERYTGDDLIKKLCNLSSNYDSIKSYLSVFISFDIVDGKYPHNIKDNSR